MNEKDIFKKACYSTDIQVLYKECLKRRWLSMQILEEYGGVISHPLWRLSTKCHQCKEEIEEKDFAYFASYWTPHLWRPVHKECRNECKFNDAYECQKIDCSCNDCGHFDRISQQKGTCTKFDKKVTPWANTCCPQNLECFTHRKDMKG